MGICGIPEIPLQQGNAVWVEFRGFLEISGNFMAVLRKCCGDFEKEFRYPLKNFRGTGISGNLGGILKILKNISALR